MMLHFLNGIVNDIESLSMTLNRHKTQNDVTSLKSKSTCKLINRIPGLRLLISSLPGSASRMHVESAQLRKRMLNRSARLSNVNKRSRRLAK